ncbi:MAG: DNA-binding protein [Legionella sp.]|jgi:hypothetical protein
MNKSEKDQKTKRKPRTSLLKQSDIELIKIFWEAHPKALFAQEVIAPVVQRTIKSLESDRWRGGGVPFRRCSGRILYRKSDVIDWIENHKLVTSTSEYNQEVIHD